MPHPKALKPSELRFKCDPKMFGFKSTAKIEPLDDVIGQERAVQAITFGLDMKSPGYNIFVTGLEGTGKSTVVRDIAGKHAEKMERPDDWCMVHNFKDDFRPKALRVPSGKAAQFARTMKKFIEDLQRELPKAFESQSYIKKLSNLKKKYAERQYRFIQQTERMAAQKGIQITRTKAGFEAIPIIDGKPITTEVFNQLTAAQQKKIRANIQFIETELERTARETNRLEMTLREDVEKLMNSVAVFVVKHRLDLIKEIFRESRDIVDFLGEVIADITENVNDFLPSDGNRLPAEQFFEMSPKSPFSKYAVNILVDRKAEKGAPVIFETNPNYYNVFGQIEKRAHMGTLKTDFTMIQAGSLLRANGGFLIMEIESVLMNRYVWELLKRALQNKVLAIEDISPESGFGVSSLRPEPIPLEVKVILIGNHETFNLLQDHDSKFNKIFRVRADFDYEVERHEASVQNYARYIARACREEHLLPFTPSGVAAVVEYGGVNIARKDKLSLRFGNIMGILKEADFWARKNKARKISEKYVRTAYEQHRFRYNLYEEKMHESYTDETIMIDVTGDEIGQVNALAVYQIGDISFGRPSRITAETYMGEKGIINIEREAELSGKTHNKGVLILSGYLGKTFAQKFPFSLTISLTFEQSYGGIDGDSASSTELYAILSSLSEIPIHQGLAVTGSVNQKGQIQAIGGVNQKIEGFYEVCLSKGLTGSQGVLIPQTNVKNLMLRHEIIDAVKKKKFHIYPVSTIVEGIELLTGVTAGKVNQAGHYPAKSVYGKVQKKLETFLKRSYRLKKRLGEGLESIQYSSDDKK